MSSLLQANAARSNADTGLPSPDTFEPFPLESAPSTAEVVASLFPSDAGGVGYLFGHDLFDAAPTPLDEVPVDRPDPAANAMGAVALAQLGRQDYSTHVNDPDNGPIEFDVTGDAATPEPAPSVAGPRVSTLTKVLRDEWRRVRDQFTIERGPS